MAPSEEVQFYEPLEICRGRNGKHRYPQFTHDDDQEVYCPGCGLRNPFYHTPSPELPSVIDLTASSPIHSPTKPFNILAQNIAQTNVSRKTISQTTNLGSRSAEATAKARDYPRTASLPPPIRVDSPPSPVKQATIMLGSAATEREKANQRDPNQRKTGYSSKDVLECYPNVYHLLWDLETLMARRHQALNGIINFTIVNQRMPDNLCQHFLNLLRGQCGEDGNSVYLQALLDQPLSPRENRILTGRWRLCNPKWPQKDPPTIAMQVSTDRQLDIRQYCKNKQMISKDTKASRTCVVFNLVFMEDETTHGLASSVPRALPPGHILEKSKSTFGTAARASSNAVKVKRRATAKGKGKAGMPADNVRRQRSPSFMFVQQEKKKAVEEEEEEEEEEQEIADIIALVDRSPPTLRRTKILPTIEENVKPNLVRTSWQPKKKSDLGAFIKSEYLLPAPLPAPLPEYKKEATPPIKLETVSPEPGFLTKVDTKSSPPVKVPSSPLVVRRAHPTTQELSDNIGSILAPVVKQEGDIADTTTSKVSTSATRKRAGTASLQREVYSDRALRVRKVKPTYK